MPIWPCHISQGLSVVCPVGPKVAKVLPVHFAYSVHFVFSLQQEVP